LDEELERLLEEATEGLKAKYEMFGRSLKERGLEIGSILPSSVGAIHIGVSMTLRYLIIGYYKAKYGRGLNEAERREFSKYIDKTIDRVIGVFARALAREG